MKKEREERRDQSPKRNRIYLQPEEAPSQWGQTGCLSSWTGLAQGRVKYAPGDGGLETETTTKNSKGKEAVAGCNRQPIDNAACVTETHNCVLECMRGNEGSVVNPPHFAFFGCIGRGAESPSLQHGAPCTFTHCGTKPWAVLDCRAAVKTDELELLLATAHNGGLDMMADMVPKRTSSRLSDERQSARSSIFHGVIVTCV